MTLETEVRLERLETMRAAHVHAFSDTPEEDAGRKMQLWAESKSLTDKGSKARLFGRDTFPTDKSEPHGYEFFLTIDADIDPKGDIDLSEIPLGLYAVLRFRNLATIKEAWTRLWTWIKENGYEHVGWRKGEHGWADGYEEHLNWLEVRPSDEWIFDLWVQLME